MLPTTDESAIKRRLIRTLRELRDEAENDSTAKITRIDNALIVTQQELAATRKELSELKELLLNRS